jgi:hypothetical protein
MQLQIECNHTPSQKQRCLTCNQIFEVKEAEVIVCDDQGKPCGEVCPQCLKRGYQWLSHRFDQINQLKKVDILQRPHRKKIPLGA